MVAGPVLGEQQAQGFDAFPGQGGAGGVTPLRRDGFELVTVPADSDAEDHPAVAEPVQGGDLLGEQDRITLGQHQDAGRQPQDRRSGGDGGQRHERLEVVRWGGPGVANIPLGAQIRWSLPATS